MHSEMGGGGDDKQKKKKKKEEERKNTENQNKWKKNISDRSKSMQQ